MEQFVRFEEPEAPAAARLRIGFLIGTSGLENWQLRVFDRVLASQDLVLEAFLVQPQTITWQPISPWLGRLARLERAVLAREPAYVPANFRANAHRFEQLPSLEDSDDDYGERASQLVLDLGLDLVIRMTSVGLPDEAVRLLRFGEWSFSFSDESDGGVDWFGYEAVLRRASSVPLALFVRHGNSAKRTCISTSAFNIKFSAARNAGFVKERAVTLLLRELDRVAETGRLVPDTEMPSDTPTGPPPSGVDLLRYSAALSSQLLSRAGNALHRKMGGGSAVWTLFMGQGDIADFDPGHAVEIRPDKDEIRADPFLLEHEGDCYLFYEAYADGASKAHIAVGRIEGDRLERLGVALACDYHLSYPFVFHDGDDLFMMPETHRARRVEIWRCVEFPLKWELYSTALHGLSPADSILTRYRDRWWLFTNLSDFHAYEDHCSELHVFEVDGPQLKKVVPHKRNPIVLGSTTARNAGRIFEQGGCLYRPSQRNENGIYGYGLNIMLVEELDSENYRERCVRTILPDFKPRLIGCHHFDAAAGRYVMDAQLHP
jgi:hypothetical protein